MATSCDPRVSSCPEEETPYYDDQEGVCSDENREEGEVPPVADRSCTPLEKTPTHLNDAYLDAQRDQWSEYLATQFSSYEPDANRLVELADRFFGNGNVTVSTSFNKSEIPLSWLPDLPVRQGAAICTTFPIHDGNIDLLANPVCVDGFTSFHPLYLLMAGGLDIRCLTKTPEGKLKVRTNDYLANFLASRRINKKLSEPPFNTFFPSGRVDSLSLTGLLQSVLERVRGSGRTEADRTTSGLMDRVAHMVRDVGLRARFFTGDETISMQIVVHLRPFLESLSSGLIREFDFSGIQVGSTVDWPGFDLSILPLPDAFALEGRADVRIERVGEDETRITLTDLHASLVLANRFNEPLVFSGNLSLTFQKGGNVILGFDPLQVEFPNFPSDQSPLASFSGELSGHVSLHFDPAGFDTLSNAALSVKNFRLDTHPTRGIGVGTSPVAFAGSLWGDLTIDYDPAVSDDLIRAVWDLGGIGLVQSGDETVELGELALNGYGSFQRIDGKVSPNLADFGLHLSADATGRRGDKDNFVIRKFTLDVKGDDSHYEKGVLTQEAHAASTAEELRIGNFALQPSVTFHLKSRQKAKEYQLAGSGNWSLSSPSPPVHVGSSLDFQTDLATFDWSARFSRELIGPLDADGLITIKGRVELPVHAAGDLFENFTIATPNPYQVRVAGEVVASGITVKGKGGEKGSQIEFVFPDILGKAAGSIALRGHPKKNHQWGDFRLDVNPYPLTTGLTLARAHTDGTFHIPPLRSFLKKPRIEIQGVADVRFSDFVDGPVTLHYEGDFIPRSQEEGKPFSMHFRFDPAQPNLVEVGPLQVRGVAPPLLARANLAGRADFHPNTGLGPLGGSGLGLLDGTVWTEQEGERLSLVENLSFVADRLLGFKAGRAHCARNGCQLDMMVHPVLASLFDIEAKSDEARHLFWARKRMPVIPRGKWTDLVEKIKKKRGTP